jgi:hypothetical protein
VWDNSMGSGQTIKQQGESKERGTISCLPVCQSVEPRTRVEAGHCTADMNLLYIMSVMTVLDLPT